jgi:3-oxoacyl-[acyl-carrier protein] reductase
MDLNLTGARAIVTGGSRGIGRAIVGELTAEGCRVEYCARNPADPTDTEWSESDDVRGSAVDIEDPDATQEWLEQAIGRLGGLDLLILNASAMASGHSREAWARNYKIEIDALANIVGIAKPHLERAVDRRGDAAIVIIGSTSARSAKKRDSYGAVKAALVHVMKGLSHELIAYGIRVNMVSPGPVYSKNGIWQVLESRDPGVLQRKIESIPLGRMGRPDEIANIVVFLCSSRASFVVGANFVADGGRSERV